MTTNALVSLRSFVKMPVILCKPSICTILTVLSFIGSRIAFYLTVIWRRPLDVDDLEQQTYALLSLKIFTGDGVGVKTEVVDASVMMYRKR